MVPELRALRLKQIAMRVQDELKGDLGRALRGSITEARKLLKKFPNISDPGADRILLFAAIAAIAAVPSNNVSVIVRLLYGRKRGLSRQLPGISTGDRAGDHPRCASTTARLLAPETARGKSCANAQIQNASSARFEHTAPTFRESCEDDRLTARPQVHADLSWPWGQPDHPFIEGRVASTVP